MTENDRLLAKLLALLLEYPDPAWREAVRETMELSVHVKDERRRRILGEFLAYSQKTPILALQETYTGTFDLESVTSLHLSYHLIGDGEDRGKVLARLVWEYGRQGFEVTAGELPDYLPLMLEFLSACPRPEEPILLRHCLTTVAPLALRLQEQHHSYGGLLGLAAEIGDCLGSPLPPLSSEREKAAEQRHGKRAASTAT